MEDIFSEFTKKFFLIVRAALDVKIIFFRSSKCSRVHVCVECNFIHIFSFIQCGRAMALNFSTFEELRMHNFIQREIYLPIYIIFNYLFSSSSDGWSLKLILAHAQGRKIYFSNHFNLFNSLTKVLDEIKSQRT